jgi:hypothetical protein
MLARLLRHLPPTLAMAIEHAEERLTSTPCKRVRDRRDVLVDLQQTHTAQHGISEN